MLFPSSLTPVQHEDRYVLSYEELAALAESFQIDLDHLVGEMNIDLLQGHVTLADKCVRRIRWHDHDIARADQLHPRDRQIIRARMDDLRRLRGYDDRW